MFGSELMTIRVTARSFTIYSSTMATPTHPLLARRRCRRHSPRRCRRHCPLPGKPLQFTLACPSVTAAVFCSPTTPQEDDDDDEEEEKTPSPTPSPNSLKEHHSFAVNEDLVSRNGMFKAKLQSDGNLVVIKNKGKEILWASQTAGKSADSLAIRAGHVALYHGKHAVWSTGVHKKAASPIKLVMQNDGNLVQYNQWGKAMWTSGTAEGQESKRYGTGFKIV